MLRLGLLYAPPLNDLLAADKARFGIVQARYAELTVALHASLQRLEAWKVSCNFLKGGETCPSSWDSLVLMANNFLL